MSRTASTSAIRAFSTASRLTALGLVVLALAGGMPGDSVAVPGRRSGSGVVLAKLQTTPSVVITAGSAGDKAMAEWALSRFDTVGLELPPMAIEFVGPSLEPCGGAQATVRLALDPVVVSVCWGSEFVMLHELAHVWEAQSVFAERRERFMLSRAGVSSWADPADQWADQGREHAANVIAWALMEDPIVIGRTYPNDRASLEEGFGILTGRKPLHAEGGEPVLVDRSEFDPVAAQQESAARGGIRSGR